MKYRRKDTTLIFNVTNPELLPLYEGNEAYEVVEEKKVVKETKADEPKKTTKKK